MSGCPPGRQCRSKADRTRCSSNIRGWSARTWRYWAARACRPADLRCRHRDLRSMGLHIATIHEPATLDRRDVLQAGDAVNVGRGGRTNSTGIGPLCALLAPLSRTVICLPAEQRAAPEVRGDRAAGEVHAAPCAALCQLAVTRRRLDHAQRDRVRLVAGMKAAEQATAWKRNRPAARGPAAGRSSRPIADADSYHLCPDPLAAQESAEFMGGLHSCKLARIILLMRPCEVRWHWPGLAGGPLGRRLRVRIRR